MKRNIHVWLLVLLALAMASIPALTSCTRAPTPTPSPTAPPTPTALLNPTATALPTPTPLPAKPVTLKWADYAMPEAVPNTLAHKRWVDEVERRSGGRVKFDQYWGGVLLKGTEILSGTGKGVTDVGFVAVGYESAKLPLSHLAEALYLSERGDAAARALTDLYRSYPPFAQEWQSKNVHVLHFDVLYPPILATSKPINRLEDLKGLKIRGFGVLNDAFAKLGAVPVALPWGEVFDALEKKVIDAVSGIPLGTYVQSKVYETLRYVQDPGMGIYAVGATVVNLDTWKALPDDVKSLINDVSAAYYIPAALAIQMDSDLQNLKVVREKGAQLVKVPDAELERFKNLVVPGLWDAMVAEVEKANLPGREFLAKYREAYAKYEPTSKYLRLSEQKTD